MTSIYIQLGYYSIEKPFRLVERIANLGKTEYDTICLLDLYNAELLVKNDIPWFAEVNWDVYFHKIKVMKAEKKKKEAINELNELNTRIWMPVSEIKQRTTKRSDVWLGWKPNEDGSEVMPRRGMWDLGSNQWVSHWEDHGDSCGDIPVTFSPQPDYFCLGFEPKPPTI